MALSDLSPEELQIVQSTLLAPPPAQFTQAQKEISPELRALGESGFLGAGGRFVQSLAKMQDQRKMMDLANRAASLTGLEPDFNEQVQRLAQANPEMFATAPVQQALNVAQSRYETARKKAEEAVQSQMFGRLMSSPQAQIEEFQRSGSPLAYKFRNESEQALKAVAEKDTLLSQIPEHMRTGLETKNLPQIRSTLTKYQNTLPPALRKKPLEDQQAMVELAKKWKAIKQTEEGKEVPEEGFASEQIKEELTGYFFTNPEGKTVSDVSIEAILQAAPKVTGEKSREEMVKRLQLDIENR